MCQSQTPGCSASSPGRVETTASPLALCSQGPSDAAEVNAFFPFRGSTSDSRRQLGRSEAVTTGPMHSMQQQCLAGLSLILLPLTSLQSCSREEAELKEARYWPSHARIQLLSSGWMERHPCEGPPAWPESDSLGPIPLLASGSVPWRSARFQKQCSLKVKEADRLGGVQSLLPLPGCAIWLGLSLLICELGTLTRLPDKIQSAW